MSESVIKEELIIQEQEPSDLLKAAEEARKALLPLKSKQNYELAYDAYNKWKQTKDAKSSSETVLLAYFHQLSHKYKPSSLWSFYSMLKNMIAIREEVDISKYKLVSAFLKNNSKGFHSKKSKVFKSSEVQKFLSEAPDYEYLATKAAFIFGICGACRGDELVNVRVEDISTHGDLLLVTLPDTKTNKTRSFVIGPEFNAIIKKYQAMRPKETSSNRFFLNHYRGKCTNQVIGKNKFAGFAKQIATYLKLPEPELYTGLSFRQTSAKLTTLKRQGSWKSSSVAEPNINESVQNTDEVRNLISPTVDLSVNKSHEKPIRIYSKRQEVENVNLEASTSKGNLLKKKKIFSFENYNITFKIKDVWLWNADRRKKYFSFKKLKHQ